ncbi:hypothetical protein DIPPA_07522 [Diplonema papillatum]|nr:hypothetical protein DIPPA_07522 [Diplonema papillatum]
METAADAPQERTAEDAASSQVEAAAEARASGSNIADDEASRSHVDVDGTSAGGGHSRFAIIRSCVLALIGGSVTVIQAGVNTVLGDTFFEGGGSACMPRSSTSWLPSSQSAR